MAKNDDTVSRLEVVPVRKAFPKEAAHFTPWLAEHIDALGERLGIPLVEVQRESQVGAFKVDLLCEDEEGRKVIIEDQLERTNHDHLGKLLTYLVNLDAKTAIWVTTDPRPEHQRVVEWLNESTPHGISFFLVKVEAVRIGKSPFAPLFTILAEPDEQAKDVGEAKKEWAEKDQLRAKFWTSLLERSKGKTRLFSGTRAQARQWIGIGAGRGGVTLNYGIHEDWANVDLYIDYDKDNGKGNKAIFDALKRQKASIEKEFGEKLDWQRLDDKRACRIAKRFEGGLSSPDRWPKLQDRMIAAMIRLDKTIRGRLAKVGV